MNKIGLIIQREYLIRVKKKSFILMTFLGPLLMAGIFIGAVLLTLADSSKHKLLVVDETPGMVFDGKLKNNEEIEFFYIDKKPSNEEFKKGPYTEMLVLHKEVVEVNSCPLYYREMPGIGTLGYIENQLEDALEDYKLALNNISRQQYNHINTDFKLVTANIAKTEDDTYKKELSVVGFVFAVVIYLFIFLYGVQVMRGVLEEKTNRIIEVLISSVKPFELMMGKIIGIALVGLTQFLLWVVLTTTLTTVAQNVFLKDKFAPKALTENQLSPKVMEQGQAFMKPVPSQTEYIFGLIDRINFPLMLGLFLFYFLFGYLLYASLFAAVGAAVDNETDTQQFMMPITIPLIFGFIIAEMALANPGSPAVVWFSIIPLTSPIVMMVRVAMGFDAGNIWQLILSMVLLVGFFVTCVWLAGKIYRTGILMYGKKPTYKELAKWLFYKN